MNRIMFTSRMQQWDCIQVAYTSQYIRVIPCLCLNPALEESDSATQNAPTGYLVEPYARKGTTKSRYETTNISYFPL